MTRVDKAGKRISIVGFEKLLAQHFFNLVCFL